MTQGLFQFNNSIINEIRNFATSSFDLLFMSGEKGSQKSETIEKVSEELQKDNLVLQHFCFENSVIDDFLLNFYDALRNFALMQKVSIKKFMTDNFKEKVSHYFKTIGTNSIIVVENFEKIENNTEVIDFLSHLAKYDNVKIIIVTRNKDKNPFEVKGLKIQNLKMGEITKEEFKSETSILAFDIDEETKEKFYNITKGLELYLKMCVKYSSTANTSIKDLINEFERKKGILKVDFEEFLVKKFVSLVPNVYKGLLKVLSAFSHPVSSEFLSEYKFGDISHIDYLLNNFLISSFRKEFYVKDYFRQYIVKAFSIQEKVNYYQKIIDCYNKELTKSPKNRLLRLSRESIRQEIMSLEEKIPSINSKEKTNKAFTYLSLASKSWGDEKAIQKSKLSEKLKKIKERKKVLFENQNEKIEEETKLEINKEEKEQTRSHVVNLINSAREFKRKYCYNEAIEELLRAREIDTYNEFEIEILILLAKNYERLNQLKIAQKHYLIAYKNACKNKDTRKSELEFLIAMIDKKQFKFNDAKEKFKFIIQNKNNPVNIIAKSSIELGEIEEANGNIKIAIDNYKHAIDIELGKDKELVCKAYYKLAVLYDENQDYNNAIKYYNKNYKTSQERNENKYYPISLTNMALIYNEQGNYKEASEYLKLALIYDSEENDYENMYFSQKELAKIYSRFDEISSIGYYKQALNSAKKLKDVFKEALVHFEMGEFFYDRQENEKALVNFFNAREILKKISDSENIQRVESRIKDIKFRLDSVAFKLIAERYDYR